MSAEHSEAVNRGLTPGFQQKTIQYSSIRLQ